MAAPAETLPAPGQIVTAQSTSTTNWAPTAKVSVGILAASLTTVIMPFVSKAMGSDPDAAQAAAITTLITFAIQYLVPDRK